MSSIKANFAVTQCNENFLLRFEMKQASLIYEGGIFGFLMRREKEKSFEEIEMLAATNETHSR